MTAASTTRAPTRGLHAIEAWMHEHAVGWICAVSPHLDDAAFSIATVLAHPALPPREVWTVFSATTADGDVAYAKATGFADPLVEFEARRAEDADSMRIIGVPFRHVGLAASRFDAAAGASIAAEIRCRAQALRNNGAPTLAALAAPTDLQGPLRVPGGRPAFGTAGRRAEPAATLVLLPAGAGVDPSAFDRLWCRVTRRPVGCRPHGEHEWIRDALAGGALAGDCLIGYYAEVPYLWSEGHTRLEARLRSTARQPLQAFAVAANVDLKHKAALAYRSQVALVLGDQPSFQRRSLSGDEWIYLPA